MRERAILDIERDVRTRHTRGVCHATTENLLANTNITRNSPGLELGPQFQFGFAGGL